VLYLVSSGERGHNGANAYGRRDRSGSHVHGGKGAAREVEFIRPTKTWNRRVVSEKEGRLPDPEVHVSFQNN
jgi:hypothetical protein